MDGLSGVEGDKDSNNSMNNSNVLDHSVSHISHESDNDAAEVLNDQLFWAATFDRCTSGNKIAVEDLDEIPQVPRLTPVTSADSVAKKRPSPEFYKIIASKLAPSYNSSLVDHANESCGSKPSLVTASTSAELINVSKDLSGEDKV